LFVDRHKTVSERIELLRNALEDLTGQTGEPAADEADIQGQEDLGGRPEEMTAVLAKE
jgi:hypothetical protein